MLELTVRLIASLAVVVGLMLLLARLVGKKYGARDGAPVQVLHRQPLSRSASVAVITVGSRVLVVGSTDHQVSLLTELDPEELVDAGLVDAELADAALMGDGFVDLDDTIEPAPSAPAPAAVDAPTDEARTGIAALTSMSSLAALRQRAPRRGPATSRRTSTDDGALAGSVLSAQTWRQAIAAATGKTS